MFISVVIPLYNKASTIELAMDSVVRQMNDNIELIVVDDGSTDRSLSIAEEFIHLYPDLNIKLYTKVNSGVSAARNIGINLASSDFVAFLDADDCYDSDFLFEISHLIESFPQAAAFATGYRFYNSSSGTTRTANIAGLTNANQAQLLTDFFNSAASGDLPVSSSSVCIRKRALVELGGFPERENMGEDQTVWSQLALRHPIAFSPRVCSTYYEEISNSLMESISPVCEMPYSKRLQQQIDQGLVPQDLSPSIKRYIRGHIFDLVRRNLSSTNPTTARNLLKDPRTKSDWLRWIYWNLRLVAKEVI